MQNEALELIDEAIGGNKAALEALVLSVENMIYNLSLRMLGSPHDAQDASQEIIIKIITQLSSFCKESTFSTWVYRIATNYLINYKKTMFAQRPLSFEYYGEDISAGFIQNTSALLQDVDEKILTDELKQSCTNVMLQCLDPESRCIYVLGLMFKVDYVTYDNFRFNYQCKCGAGGSIHIAFGDKDNAGYSKNKLTNIKNRLCCPNDASPLLTILEKKLNNITYRNNCRRN